MKIIRLKEGFSNTQEARTAEFVEELNPLYQAGPILFRGTREPCAFHCGTLQSIDRDTAIFITGGGERLVYPLWEIMVAVE